MRVGFCNGCFDLLHEGHLHFLEQASTHCDYLIVAVNNDRSVRELKGAGRPIEPVEIRMANILARASAYVGALIPFDGNPFPLLWAIHPEVIIRGADQSDEGHTLARLVRVPRRGEYSTSLQLAQAKAKTGA